MTTTPGELFSNGDGSSNSKKLDTICLFDVDGTIAMSRQVIIAKRVSHK
jgi:hypothetical protein